MKLIKLKPITNGTRHQVNLKKSILSKNNRLIRSSIKQINSCFGKSSTTGHTTSWHKSSGHKKLFRNINCSNQNYDAIVLSICYDPYRSSFISLNFDFNKKYFFRTISTNLILPGCLLKCNPTIKDLKLGFRTTIINIPTGSIVHNLSIRKEKKAQYIRSAGTCGQIVQRGENSAKIKLPSNLIIEIPTTTFASLGVVSNAQNNLTILGKAGRNRHLGRRPIVRGIAMNPVDHPHGGRSNGGKPSVTPWGLPTKNKFVLKKRK